MVTPCTVDGCLPPRERERERDVHCKRIHPILNWTSWFSFNGIRVSFAVLSCSGKSQRCRQSGGSVLLSTGPMGNWCFINHTSLAVMMRNTVFNVSNSQIYEQPDHQSRGCVSANNWYVKTLRLISQNFQVSSFIFSVLWGEEFLLQTRIFHRDLLCCFVSVFNRAYCPDSKLLSFISPRSTGRSKFTIGYRTAASELQESSSSSFLLLADKFSSVDPRASRMIPRQKSGVRSCACVCACKSLERSPNDAAHEAGRNEVKCPLIDLAAGDKWL